MREFLFKDVQTDPWPCHPGQNILRATNMAPDLAAKALTCNTTSAETQNLKPKPRPQAEIFNLQVSQTSLLATLSVALTYTSPSRNRENSNPSHPLEASCRTSMSSMYRPSGPAQAGRRPCFPKLGYVLGLGLIESRVLGL